MSLRHRIPTQTGELRERISIERATTTSDGAGGQNVSWSRVYTNGVWAKVKPMSGGEEQRLGRLSTVEHFLVTVRFGISVTTLDRIIWRGKTLNVRAVQDLDLDREFLTCDCESGVTT